MLSDSDAALIARDPSIAGLKLLLDSEALYATLAEKLPRHQLVGADTEYLRYKPGVSCLARIRLHTQNGESSAYAMAYQSLSSDKLRKAAGMSDATNAKPILLPEHAIAVFPFPLDRRLPSLGRFMHRASILKLVERRAPSLLEDKKDVEFSTLRYKPERRYVAQLSEAGRPFAALKMYSTDGYHRAWCAVKIIGCNRLGYAQLHRPLRAAQSAALRLDPRRAALRNRSVFARCRRLIPPGRLQFADPAFDSHQKAARRHAGKRFGTARRMCLRPHVALRRPGRLRPRNLRRDRPPAHASRRPRTALPSMATYTSSSGSSTTRDLVCWISTAPASPSPPRT